MRPKNVRHHFWLQPRIPRLVAMRNRHSRGALAVGICSWTMAVEHLCHNAVMWSITKPAPVVEVRAVMEVRAVVVVRVVTRGDKQRGNAVSGGGDT